MRHGQSLRDEFRGPFGPWGQKWQDGQNLIAISIDKQQRIIGQITLGKTVGEAIFE